MACREQAEYVLVELMVISMSGLMILYHWKIRRIASRLPGTEQNGCLNEALGVKYSFNVSF